MISGFKSRLEVPRPGQGTTRLWFQAQTPGNGIDILVYREGDTLPCLNARVIGSIGTNTLTFPFTSGKYVQEWSDDATLWRQPYSLSLSCL